MANIGVRRLRRAMVLLPVLIGLSSASKRAEMPA
jgi:hypothetical protein